METQRVEEASLKEETVDNNDNNEECGDMRISPTFDFTQKTWKDDFVFIVENTRLHVVKGILAYASPVFDTMFQSDFQEKNLSELELPGKKVEDVQKFLQCIYPNQSDICAENVNAVLPLAEEYQVSNLKSRCEAFLLNRLEDSISTDDLYSILEKASLYNMPRLLKACVVVASDKKVESLHRADDKMKIKPEVKCMILDRMVSRLQPKDFLENLKRYYETFLDTQNKLEIKDYMDWDGNSLNISVHINKWKLFQVDMHAIKADCMLFISDMQYDSSIFKVVKSTKGGKVQKIKIFGRIVVKPISGEKSELKKQINFDYSENTKTEVKIQGLQCGHNFSRNGFVYHDTIDVELLLLAKKVK